jgi:predicted nucleic acid-binding protein
VAETVYVLESYYKVRRHQIAEAYLVACAETTGIEKVASFDKAIDRITTVERIEPPRAPN